MRRFYKDALVSVGALLIVFLALTFADGRVREHVTGAVAHASSPQAVTQAGGQLRRVADSVVTTARDQSIENAPVVIFVSAAAVLVVFMLRL